MITGPVSQIFVISANLRIVLLNIKYAHCSVLCKTFDHIIWKLFKDGLENMLTIYSLKKTEEFEQFYDRFMFRP